MAKSQDEVLQLPKKKGNFFVSFLKAILFGVLGLVIIAGLWVLYSTFFSESIEDYVQEPVSLYASVPSASTFVSQTLELKALDEVLSAPSLAEVYSLVKLLRSNELLSSKLFSFLANIRLDASVNLSNTTSENPSLDVSAFGNLGFRSCVTRLLPLALKVKPNLVDNLDVDGLELHQDSKGYYFSFELSPESTVLFRFYKNLFFAKLVDSTYDKTDFIKVLNKNSEKFRKTLKKDLAKSKGGTLSILADFNEIKPLANNGGATLEKILNEISFPERSDIKLNLKTESIALSGNLKLKTDNPSLSKVLSEKGSVPKSLNRLPDTTEYFTLLNFQTPKDLLENLDEFLPNDIKSTYKSANNLVRTLLGTTIDELVLSWLGEELGVFAVEGVSAPVFYASITNRQKCDAFFERLFNSPLIDRNSSTIIDGIRISRITFPPIVASLLKLFKIDLPTPFYFIDGDFVFFSEASEGIAKYKQSFGQGHVITKNEQWKKMLSHISSETSFTLYYNLDRSIPMFLQNNKMLSNILSHYATGLFSFKLEHDQNSSFNFYAEKNERTPLGRLSAFPKQMEAKLLGELHFSKTNSGSSYLFWSSGEKLYSFDIVGDKVQSLKVDSQASIILEEQNQKFKAVWAITKNGTVYRMNENLVSMPGFPVITSVKSIGNPALVNNTLVFSAQDDEHLVYVFENGSFKVSENMLAKMRNSPAALKNTVAALPRSFDSTVYFFNQEGNLSFDYIELDGISAITPLLIENAKQELITINITETGIYTVDYVDSTNQKDERNIYTVELPFSCQIQPVFSKNSNSIFIIDTENVLHALNLDGSEKNAIKLSHANNDLNLTLHDVTHDGIDEIFISGGGNAIYAYDQSLNLINGFPISGISNPIFVDVNGDGSNDILTFGIDNKLHAFEGLIQ